MKTGFLVLFSYFDVQKQWKVFRFHNEAFKHSSNSSEFHTVLSRMIRWRSITVGCLCFYTLSQASCTDHYPKKAIESGCLLVRLCMASRRCKGSPVCLSALMPYFQERIIGSTRWFYSSLHMEQIHGFEDEL